MAKRTEHFCKLNGHILLKVSTTIAKITLSWITPITAKKRITYNTQNIEISSGAMVCDH